MSNDKIVDLNRFRRIKNQKNKISDHPNKKELSLEDKLKDLIHRPFNNPGTKEELIWIYEEEQIKKDEEDNQ